MRRFCRSISIALEEEQPWAPGAASRWYLHQSLRALRHDLHGLGLEIETARGASGEHLLSVAARTGATQVYWNQIHEPTIKNRDERVADNLRAAGLKVRIFHDHSLIPPGDLKNNSGGHYRVFTPFWRRLENLLMEAPPHHALYPFPSKVRQPALAETLSITSLGLLDTHPWHHKLHRYWQAGERTAGERLDAMLHKLEAYPEERDFPAQDATSRLSTALHFGELSPWRLVETLRPAYQGEWGTSAAQGAGSLLRQLGWREFAIHLLHTAPDSPNRSLQAHFENSGIWFDDPNFRAIWQRGRTGFPLVDAGMSELWETGWMHNRVRMVTASLLTKNLGQHWIHGARWFWDTLVDADLANNTLGWQWVAGCGCDAAPYYRVFNPLIQAKRFDPEGRYITRWLDVTKLTAPIVDLSASHKAALERYARLSKASHDV